MGGGRPRLRHSPTLSASDPSEPLGMVARFFSLYRKHDYVYYFVSVSTKNEYCLYPIQGNINRIQLFRCIYFRINSRNTHNKIQIQFELIRNRNMDAERQLQVQHYVFLGGPLYTHRWGHGWKHYTEKTMFPFPFTFNGICSW